MGNSAGCSQCLGDCSNSKLMAGMSISVFRVNPFECHCFFPSWLLITNLDQTMWEASRLSSLSFYCADHVKWRWLLSCFMEWDWLSFKHSAYCVLPYWFVFYRKMNFQVLCSLRLCYVLLLALYNLLEPNKPFMLKIDLDALNCFVCPN